MRYVILALSLQASAAAMAEPPGGYHYGTIKNSNEHNQFDKNSNYKRGLGQQNRTLAVPEPSTLALLGIGLAGIAGFAAHRRKK